MTQLLRPIRQAWANRRVRIVFFAVLIGIVCGTLQLTVPLEDAFIAARNKLRSEPASGSIVLVKIDDPTLESLHANDVSRGDDAKVIDVLMRNGAERVYFARSYPFSPKAQGSDALLTALERYSGKVSLGIMPKNGEGPWRPISNLPAAEFRKDAKLVSLAAAAHPFNLGYSLPYLSNSIVGPVPSLSAALAGVPGTVTDLYRPSYTIDYRTVPTISYIDVLEGRVDPELIAHRTLVVGRTSMSMNLYHPIPLGPYVPNVYFHILGAETLMQRRPVDVGWLPAVLAVTVLIVTGVGRRRSSKPWRLAGYALVIVVLPVALDRFSIHIAVMPAALMAIYATFRAGTLDKISDVSETNAASGLPSLQPLRTRDEIHPGALIALKVRNYAGILRSFSAAVEADLASEIQRRIRISEPDVTVYHEGDMFVWLSALADIVEIRENLEGLQRIAQNGIVIEGTEVDVGFNCGVDSDVSRPVAIRLANAMQSAEEAVRTDEPLCHYDKVPSEEQWEISLLASLDRAIDNGEVWVAFQPKLDLATNRIVGAEALARWSHPERGPISPEKFIGLAEEYHRIERITEFVLDKAIGGAAELVREGHDFTISVNISAQLLRNPRLPRMIVDALVTHDFAPDRLILEITETDRFDKSKRTAEMMQVLVGTGVGISIDDFGTGNATIDYLRYLPASEVKIDKLFIAEIESNPDDQLLAQSIIEMAHSLGRRVVAEGVESAESLSLLRQLRCDEAQGYFVSRPIPFRDLGAFLRAKVRRGIG